MHILIEAVGSAGDVHPFLAIGETLRARGHEVDVLASAYFAERVAQAGLGFIALGTVEDYQRAVAQTDLWHPRYAFRTVWRETAPNLLPCYELLQKHIRPGETVMVGSTLAWSVRMAQERLGVPAATVHLSPGCILSADAPARMPGIGTWFEHLPVKWRRRLLDWLERNVLDRITKGELNALRAQIGLPPIASHVFSRWMNSPQSVICAFPDWYCAPQNDWPPTTVTTGFPLWRTNAAQTLSPQLEEFLAAGDKPIGFTPGSAMAFGRKFFERALAACTALGRRAIFVTPFRDQLPRELPAHIHHAAYAPFDLLIPRLTAFVHHGGIGTTAQTMAAAIPQLITPFAHDQFDNAARVARLGVGVQLAPSARVGKWVKALDRLINDKSILSACRELASRTSDNESVLRDIAMHIEQLSPSFPRVFQNSRE